MTEAVISLPEILNIPPKLLPMVTNFNDFDIFFLEGGRGSAKSHSVGRFLLFLGEENKIRVVCGREIQANIEESVYTLLKDLIEEYNLAYKVFKTRIVHRTTGTEFRFKGFRDQGNVSVKGLEGVDILWIDEAQSITKHTLGIIMPTIRKNNSRVFFTMNRYMRDDAVPEYCIGHKKCLHIQINYFENPFCPLSLKIQAEDMKAKSLRDYNHIWLGHPLSSADEYLFNYDKLDAAIGRKWFGDEVPRKRVLAIDFAAQGNDQCVATVLDRMTSQHWKLTERIPWDEDDSMVSTGRIVNYIGQFKPDVVIIDVGGMGKVVYDRLHELKLDVKAFDGGSTDGIDNKAYGNVRAAAYYTARDWFDLGYLCLEDKDREVIKQAEKIKAKPRSDGKRFIQSKQDMKKELKYSPDDMDSLMMAIWGAVKHLGRDSNSVSGNVVNVVKRNVSARAKSARRR
jgi:phage terminase large subunit